MLTWTGVLDRPAYLRKCAIVIAVLIGTILLFPFVLRAIVGAFRCGIDTCGAVGLIVATVLRPILFAVTLAMGLSACIRRARDAGLRPWIGAFPIVMLAADQDFLQYAGAGWAYAFSSGVFGRMPVYALFGVVLMGLLAVPARDTLRGGGNRTLDWVLAVMAGWLTLGAMPRVLNVLFLTQLSVEIRKIFYVFSRYAVYAMLLFFVLAACRIWLSRSPASARGAREPERLYREPEIASETPDLWQPKRAVLIGVAITFAIILWSLRVNEGTSFGSWSAVLFGLIVLLPTLVPSFVIYTALTAAGLRLAAKRDLIAITAFLICLIPFGLWMQSSRSALAAKAQGQATIAAIPKTSLPAKIEAVVIEGDDWSLINCARLLMLSGNYHVGDVLTRGQGSSGGYLRYTKATANGAVDRGIAADSVPADHVLIRFSRSPKLAPQTGLPRDAASPPVEIYAVEAGGERLVAFTYTAFNRPPHFPPMLTSMGWFRGSNASTSQTSCKSTDAFIQRELLDKLPPRRT